MPFAKKPLFITLLSSLSLIFSFSSISANAQEYISQYTKIDLEECTILNADDFGVQFACPGYKGYPLYVAEGDLRFFVSYGFGALDEKAASQTLPNFNTINETLEWRLSKQNGEFKPIATILRWFPDISDQSGGEFKQGSILVVTKIQKNNTCHVAYIDAQLVDGANEIAQNIADNAVKDFNCETDEILMIPS